MTAEPIYWPFPETYAELKERYDKAAAELEALQKEKEELKFSTWSLSNAVASYEAEVENLRTQNRELREAVSDFVTNVKMHNVAGWGDCEPQFDASFKRMEQILARIKEVEG